MRISTFGPIAATVGILLAATGASTAPAEFTSTGWDTVLLDSTGDVGRFCRIDTDSTGNLRVVYLRTDNGNLLELSRIGGVWSLPVTRDSTGTVSGECDISGSRIGYRRTDLGALAYAGPERSQQWQAQPIDNSADDVGGFIALAALPGGTLAATCQNASQGALVLYEADSAGVWSGPTTVDPGPDRGQNCDVAWRDGVGLVFSERDTDQNMLVYADPSLATISWSRSTLAATDDSGRFVSMTLEPNGSVACAFYEFQPAGFGKVRVAELASGSEWSLLTAVPTIGRSASDLVYTAIARGPTGGWHLAFRDPVLSAVFHATTDSAMFHPVYTDALPTELPAALALRSGFPNPLRESTLLRFQLPHPALVELALFDVSGRRVRTLLQGEARFPGVHEIAWDGRDDRAARVPSGVYFCRLVTREGTHVQRLVVLR